MESGDFLRLPEAEIRRLSLQALASAGISPAQAEAMTEIVTAAEMDECRSHGLYRVIGCVAAVKSGKVDPKAEVRVIRDQGAIVRLDAQGGFAPLAIATGRPLLEAAARRSGIAALAVNNCYHFSALWADVEPVAARGLTAFAFTVGAYCVTLAGGTRPAFGTNPFAFAFPRGPGRDPFVFDISSSIAARGEVELLMRAGRQTPPGWGVDADGAPTSDPAAILGGALHAFGGPKGAAIGLMVELMAGPMVGDLRSAQAHEIDTRDGGPLRGGYLMLALDPSQFDERADQLDRIDAWLAGLSADHAPARLPSERRFKLRQRNREQGALVSRPIVEELERLISA